jgi:hypothetical protein
MIIQKGIPNEELRKGYWFRASNEHIYIVELKTRYSDKDGELMNVIATVYEPDCNNVDDNIDITKFKKGEEVDYCWLFDDDDWIMSIDIWGKYYFPTFNEEQNQWYHRMKDDEACYMDDFSFILKEAYKKAFEVTGLKTY